MYLILTSRSGKGRAQVLWTLLGLLLTFQAFATDYYVAKTGSITNDGRSIDSPFLTIQQAADVAHAGDVVYVREGVYREQVDLKSDGVTYRPYGNDEVTLNGTDLMRNWTRTDGTTSTYQTTMNWNVDASWGSNQLFEDGRMIELARWPDQTSADLVMPTNATAEDVTRSGSLFTIIDEQFNEPAARWVGAKIWVNTSRGGSGQDGQGWTGTVRSISGNTITADLTRNVAPPDQAWGLGVNTEYFLFDPLPEAVRATGGVDALLAPGEWWKNGDTLYVKTRNEQAPNNNPNPNGTGGNVIEAKRRHFAFFPGTVNRAGYTIQDFHLFACSITTDRNAFRILGDRLSRRIVEEAHDITLSGLTVKYPSHQTDMTSTDWQGAHYGFTGIVLSGRNNVIRDCDISLSATSALSFNGVGNKMLNNRIHDTNYMCSNSGAVNTAYICRDAEIAYNTIWNTTVMGINYKFVQSSNPAVKHTARIHHNEIFDFMRRSYDSAALDMVGVDLQWIRIDHNRIYNTLADARIGNRKYGIYLDFGSGSRDWRIRATVDHNVVYQVNNPLTLNTGADVHIFNNVLLSVEEVLGDSKERTRALSINLDLSYGPKVGENIKVYNNILSEEPAFGYGHQERVSLLNNLTNAKGAVLDELFVDATNSNLGARNYALKPTATRAIDQGISVDEYTSNYDLDRPVAGITDIGAYEWGTFLDAPDTEAPSVPSEAGFVVSEQGASAFRLSWEPSTDNTAVAFYEVHANGVLVKSTDKTELLMTELTPSTSYFVSVLAVDASGNRSELSNRLEVKTILNNLTIRKTSTVPVIDGTREATWSSPLLPIATGFDEPNRVPPTTPADLSGEWTSLWDANNLYLFIDVNDDVQVVDSGTSWWNDDHVEFYIDADGSRPKGYGNKQYQFAVPRGSSQIIKAKGETGIGTSTIEVSNVEKPGGSGYRVEIKIPFVALGVTAEAYKLMGIDVQIGDDDDGGSEDTRMGWFSSINNVYNDPTLMAVAQLVEEGTPDNITPSVPRDVKAVNILPNQFTLTWTASSDNVGVQSYEVFVNGNLVATPTTTSVTLKELTEGTTYSVQVKAKDRSANLSALSSVVNITTSPKELGVRYEAEEAVSTGRLTTISNQESGYSGSGYVQIIYTVGASVTFTVEVPKAGTYPVSLIATSNVTNLLSYYVNGTLIGVTSLVGTPTANDWAAVTELLPLKAGTNTIMYQAGVSDGTRRLNLDYLLLYPSPGADSEAPSVPKDLVSSNVTADSFTLSWKPSTDDSGIDPVYEVYQDGELVERTAETTYNATSLMPGAYEMTVKAIDAVGNQSDASEVKVVTTSTAGMVTQEVWTNIAGTSVSNIPVNTAPSSISLITSLEDPTPSSYDDEYNNFGQRIRGYIVPSTTATYYFYIASDNNGEFWLSTDEQPANKGTAPIAQLNGSTAPREWTKDVANQKSAGQALLAGRKYYFEALMKESSGNNNLAIGWTTATNNAGITVIGSSNLEAYVPTSAVSWVAVNPSSADIVKGATQQLKATIFPAKATNPAVSWTSSNPSVATVDNQGLVTGVEFGSATITVTTADGSKTATSVFTVGPKSIRGQVTQEIWTNVAGTQITSIPLDRKPNKTQVLTSLEDPTPLGSGGELDNFGQRIRGYIIPPATATYYFYIASDNEGEFWLSSDYLPANKGTAPIAWVIGATDARQWTNPANAANQKSVGKNLIAGNKYYFEALMKEGLGGNHLAIGWTTATNNSGITVIGSLNLSSYEEECPTCRPSVAVESKPESSELVEDFPLRLHPNPASSQVSIDLSGFAQEAAVQISISDMSGKLFVSAQIPVRDGSHRVNLSQLPQGLFVVRVQGSKTAKTAKLVITK